MRSLAALALLLLGCEQHTSVARPAPPVEEPLFVGDADRGEALAIQFECARCHDGVVGEPTLQQQCAGCHEDILDGTLEVPAGQHWRDNIHSLPSAPSLQGAHRFAPEWIAEFLQNPHDLRPNLEATMPRLAIDATDARDLAAFLTRDASESESWEFGEARRGREIVRSRACGTCHLESGQAFGEETTVGLARTLAPDLAVAATRFRKDLLVSWLLDPAALHRGTRMPAQGLSESEARDVAAHLLTLEMPSPPAAPDRLPVLEREVMFDEVETQVFRAVCWHCHADPDLAMGDGGPGNTGGFGFEARRVNLGEYESIQSGALNTEGRRASLFREVELNGEQMPLLVATLRARQLEEAGVEHDGPRGMPLGLPAMSPEAIQLVETWIAQGRHR